MAFGRRVTLFRLFDFQVRIDSSWIILAALVTWSLALGWFPRDYQDLPRRTYWWMGVAGALGLFASIIFHELCHSLVARRYGLPIKGITLFIFGGVAEMHEEPPSAGSEFTMAAAGPLSSVLLGAALYLLYKQGPEGGWPVPVSGVLSYLAFINIVLAVFNVLPAFPLDGGRILRAVLWGWKGNLRWATRIASRIGTGFGVALVVLGALQFFRGNLIGGIWLFMIGMFLQNAARASYQQVLTRQLFEGEKVRRLMKLDPISVPPSVSVSELVEKYFYPYQFKTFPVVDQGDLLGFVSIEQVKEIPHREWDRHSVGELVQNSSPENTIPPETDVLKALAIMNRTGNSRLLVAEGGRLVGIVSLKDLLNLLSLKMDLENYGK